MNAQFSKIGLFVKHTSQEMWPAFHKLASFLSDNGHQLYFEQHAAEVFDAAPGKICPADKIGYEIDIAIVMGGDGSLLKAARSIVNAEVPIIGINRGNIGFLADIHPEHFQQDLKAILAGECKTESRTLINVTRIQHGIKADSQIALNEAVIYKGGNSRMFEFEIYIDDQFVSSQRSDGLIASTPTGSTAYSLSGGGPILYPTLNAFILLPMFAHTLSSRPLVVPDDKTITIVIPPKKDSKLVISCDSQTEIALGPGDQVQLSKHAKSLQLLHPAGYNYFEMLRQKLGWNVNFTSDRFTS